MIPNESTNVPQGYDPVTLNQYLWFKLRCHECSPTEFQRLFEEIVVCLRQSCLEPKVRIGIKWSISPKTIRTKISRRTRLKPSACGLVNRQLRDP